jgi:hypothetical protein
LKLKWLAEGNRTQRKNKNQGKTFFDSILSCEVFW